MYAGRLVETGAARTLFRNPAHPYTRGLLDCIPVPGRTVPGAPLGAIRGQVPSLIGRMEGCAFRNRCDLAGPECAGTVPLLHPEPTHDVRCLHAMTSEAAA
jgi:peptide/nickel transport system ATP-binding protein